MMSLWGAQHCWSTLHCWGAQQRHESCLYKRLCTVHHQSKREAHEEESSRLLQPRGKGPTLWKRRRPPSAVWYTSEAASRVAGRSATRCQAKPPISPLTSGANAVVSGTCTAGPRAFGIVSEASRFGVMATLPQIHSVWHSRWLGGL